MPADCIEQATAAWEDSRARPAVFELLGGDAAAAREEYVNGCLADLQLLCEAAWERGEIGPEGEQLRLPFQRRSG